MDKAKKLDQFYTKEAIASWALAKVLSTVPEAKEAFFIEPSAGTGAFLKALDAEGLAWVASDIDPKFPGVKSLDFTKSLLQTPASDNKIVIGNPPFGKKASLAITFLNNAFSYAPTVAFILPVQFRRYGTQNKVLDEAKLVLDELCPDESFIFNGKPYKVRACLQIWTIKSFMKDLRIREKPPIAHRDFSLWIYNATPATVKVLDEAWELAILRQGWGSFDPIERHKLATPLSTKKQWMLIKAKDNETLKRLLAIDYAALANSNTSVKGFGKADLVEEYTRLYGT